MSIINIDSITDDLKAVVSAKEGPGRIDALILLPRQVRCLIGLLPSNLEEAG